MQPFLVIFIGVVALAPDVPPEPVTIIEGRVVELTYIPEWGSDDTVVRFEDGQQVRIDSQLNGIHVGSCYRMVLREYYHSYSLKEPVQEIPCG